MLASRLFPFLIMPIFAVNVFFELPFVVCALISGVIIGFTTFIYFVYVHKAHFFKNQVEQRRNSNTNTDGSIFERYIILGVSESVDEFWIYCRNALCCVFGALLGILLQLCNGWVAEQFFLFQFQLIANMFVSLFIAQYATDAIWFCSVVMIQAVASTTQALVVGPLRIAMTTLFRIAKMSCFAIFGKIRKMFAFAATSAFPALLQSQGEVEYGVDMYDEGYESGTDSDYESECDESDWYASEDTIPHKAHVFAPRRSARIANQDPVEYYRRLGRAY
jgi:hypothetical protein